MQRLAIPEQRFTDTGDENTSNQRVSAEVQYVTMPIWRAMACMNIT